NRRRRLFLARDRMGIKPLYYMESRGRIFAFASEVKALLGMLPAKPSMDLEALNCFLTFLWVPDPQTMFRGIQKLAPGHYLLFENGAARIHCYWDLKFEASRSGNEKDWSDRLAQVLRDAVRRQMVSDVPLGAFLSGGIDSGSIVSMMSSASSQPVSTYTIKFREKDLAQDV